PREENAREAPCWSCAGPPLPGTFSCEQYARYAARQGIIPAIQTGAAALGALCAEVVIGLLHGRESVARRVAFDLLTGESRVFRVRPDPECSQHHRHISSIENTGLTPDMTANAAIS